MKKRENNIAYILFIFEVILISVVISFLGCQKTKNESSNEKILFNKIPAQQSGLSFSNNVNENSANFFLDFNYVYDGAGVSTGDINNDGLADIYLVGNEVPNKLYLNKGDFTFEDITTKAGVSGTEEGGWHNGSVMVDINQDGYLDIYVTRGGWETSPEKRKNLLFINNGDLTFTEQAEDYGLAESGYSIHASFFDMDNDNDLDVYITNRPEGFFLPAPKVLEGKHNPVEHARDKLYRNDDGIFNEMGLEAGIQGNYGYGLSVVTSDLNQDGFTDIFVANDFLENDYLYINQGDGTFKESIRQATNHNSFYSMGTDVVDINNDGLEDITVSEMLPEDYVRTKTSKAHMSREGYQNIIDNGFHHQYMHNVLHLNRGNGFFSEIGNMAGIARTDWSWAVLGEDFDNDGWRDLFITNGLKRDVNNLDAENRGVKMVQQNRGKYPSREAMIRGLAEDLINQYPPNKLGNYIFKNNGNLTFTDQSRKWGIQQPSFSHGAAVADFNNDGAPDLVVNNMDDEPFLFKNRSNQVNNNNYLAIKLKGPGKNRNGLGGKISIQYGNQQQFFEMKSVRGYLSSSPSIAHFGLGSIEHVDQIKVKWPDGLANKLENVKANQILTIDYQEAGSESKEQNQTEPLVQDVTEKWFEHSYLHQENEYDDFRSQTLLPHSRSKNGPFISTVDVNKDGLEDFYIGGASGFAGQLFIQEENGRFKRENIPDFAKDKRYEDMGSLFFDANGDKFPDLYVVSGGSEFPKNSEMYQDRLYLNDGNGRFTRSDNLPKITASGSCIAPYDFDGDGDTDLFIGGRLVPEAYPYPAQSYLLVNENGRFRDVTQRVAPEFKELGMVTSAVWANVDGEEGKELMVAGEWMPLSVFKMANEKFTEISSSLNLGLTEGWWQSLTVHDYDGDGDQDILAGNAGLNQGFKPSIEKPLHVYAGDLDNNGTNEIILARPYQGKLVPIRNKNRLEKQMPFIKSKFTTHKAFAEAGLQEIIGPALEDAYHLKVHTLASQVFINTEYGFQKQNLPMEAQVSAVNGFVVGDYNQDDIEDFLLAGNNYHFEFATTRADASVGLILKLNEDGKFEPIHTAESGLFLPYDVKSLTPISFGKNNAQGILVGANQDTLRLLRVGRAQTTKMTPAALK